MLFVDFPRLPALMRFPLVVFVNLVTGFLIGASTLHPELPLRRNHFTAYSAKAASQIASYRQTPPVATQARLDKPITESSIAVVEAFEPPSLSRTFFQSGICPALRCCSNATQNEACENQLEMQILLETLSGGGSQVWGLRRPLDKGDGSHLNPQTSSTSTITRSTTTRCRSTLRMELGQLARRSQSGCCSEDSKEEATVYLQTSETTRKRGKRCREGLALSTFQPTAKGVVCQPSVALCNLTSYHLQCSPFDWHTMATSNEDSSGDQPQADGVGRAHHRCGDSAGPQGVLSGHGSCPTKDKGYGGKGRTSTDWPMESEHGLRIGQVSSSQGHADTGPRGQRTTSPCMAPTFGKVCSHLAGLLGCLQKATSAIRPAHQEGQPGHLRCRGHNGRPRKGQPNYDPERGRGRNLSSHGSCGAGEDKTGGDAQSKGHWNLKGVRRPDQGRSDDRCRRGRSRQATAQTSTLSRAWRSTLRLVILGNTLTSLRNVVCEPAPILLPFKHMTFCDVEAYNGCERRALDSRHCAACIPRQCVGSSIFHSIMLEDDCCFEFNAIHNAELLEQECRSEAGNDFIFSTSTTTPLIHQIADDLPDPLGALISPFDRLHQHHIDYEFGSDPDDGPHWEVPGDELAGQILHIPTIPLEQQAQWIQQIYGKWTRHYGAPSDEDEIHVRSWYLHPNRFESTIAWRPLRLPPNPDQWDGVVKAVWHDLVEHERAIDFFVVEPDPQRTIADQHFFADVILCQQLAVQPLARPALVVTQLIGQHLVRQHNVARLLPWETNKWEMIYMTGNDHFCAGPSLPVDFHRLRIVRRGLRHVQAPLVPVEYGDCFTIDIYPPTQIAEEFDDFAMLSTQAVTHSRSLESDAAQPGAIQ